MKGFIYGLGLQWKMDIRSKSMLIACYLVPLLFFVFVGGVFTSTNPESKYTLIQSMSIMGVIMGGVIGLPPSLVEVYGGDVKKVYKANGVPIFLEFLIHSLSAFIHLLIMCTIIFVTAPIIFDSVIPSNIVVYLLGLGIFIGTTLAMGSAIGLVIEDTSKVTMASQIIFLPSIMLSGIMFPVEMLPKVLQHFSKIFPATWAFKAMTSDVFDLSHYIPMLVVFVISILICAYVLLKKIDE